MFSNLRSVVLWSSDWLSGWQGSPVHALFKVLLIVIVLLALGVGGAMFAGTLRSRAGCGTLGSVVLCSGNWFIGWLGSSGSAVLCSSNWFSGWFGLIWLLGLEQGFAPLEAKRHFRKTGLVVGRICRCQRI